MTDLREHIKDLEALEAFLGDVERALAGQEAVSEEDLVRLEELRRRCAAKRQELAGDDHAKD